MELVDDQAGALDDLLTREVRWFFDGPLPNVVHTWWFAHDADVHMETRFDQYDVVAARSGIGSKLRHTGEFNVKQRLALVGAVELAPGLMGLVEDWQKTTRPAANAPGAMAASIAVIKRTASRRFGLGTDAGCEVELASVEAGDRRAWSLCFETFGRFDAREEAMASAVRLLLAESPLPSGHAFPLDASRSYPEWIAEITA